MGALNKEMKYESLVEQEEIEKQNQDSKTREVKLN